MNPFEMVVMIVAIVVIGRVISARYGIDAWGKRGRRGRDRDFGAPQNVVSIEDGVRMKSEIDRLNERIQVLERLATDPSKRLSDQIDALDSDRGRDPARTRESNRDRDGTRDLGRDAGRDR